MTSRTLKLVSGLAASIAFSVCNAVAQPQTSNSLFAEPEVITSYSVNEMIALLATAGLEARFAMEWPDGDNDKAVETTIEGVTVYFNLRACASEGADAPCQIVQPTIYFEGDGVSLAQLNNYHLNKSRASVAGLEEDGDITFWSKIWLIDGITLENLKSMIGLFLADAEMLSQALYGGSVVAAEAGGAGALGPHMARAKAEYPWRNNTAREGNVGFVPADLKSFLLSEISAADTDD